MSLFPAYSAATSSATPVIQSKDKDIKTSDEKSGRKGALDWLSLNSFNDNKVIDLNNEIIVDKTNESDVKEKDKKSSRREKSSDRRSRSKRHESKSSAKAAADKSMKLSQLLTNKTFIEETGLSPENAFRFDRKRDKNNFAFNSLYFKDIPKYDKNKTINISKRKREKNDDSNDGRRAKRMRYYSHENQLLLSKLRTDLIDMSKPETKPMIKSLNFIPLSYNQTLNQLSIESKSSQSNPLGVYDSKTALWSQGKGGLDEISVPESNIQFQSMKDKNSKNEPFGPNRCPTREQYIYDKTQEYNSYLKDNERDVQKWLQFIAFQDKTVEPFDTNKDKIDGKAIDVVIAEKKLAICEKALSLNPKSIELLLCRLDIVSNIWENHLVMKEWKRLTFLFPNSLQLWRKYICFSQQFITHFNSSKTLKVYEKCIKIMSQMLEKTFKSHSPPKDLESELVSILSSYSHFLLTIGQTERAVAVFQALIEFNLFTPSLLTNEMSVQDWITLFEPFWDSGCPRFGEDGAIGWAQVLLKKNVINGSQNGSEIQEFIDSEENKIITENKDKSVVWLKFELLRQRFNWLPARSGVDIDVEDPEREVCSDDVMEVLIRFRETDSKYRLVKEFLKFLNILNTKSDESIQTFDDLYVKTIQIPDFCLHLPLLPPFFKQQDFVENIFKTSLQLFFGENKSDLVLHWIEYEKRKTVDKMSAKEMRKFIKEFLRDESLRNDLKVWSEFVSFEYSLAENRVDGRKVFQTAIQLMINSNENKQKLFKFVRNYVELELEMKSLSEMSEELTKRMTIDSKTDDLCLNSLLSLSLNQLISNWTPTLVLKAMNALKQVLEPTIDHLFCLVLITYLTKGLLPTIHLIEEYLAKSAANISEKQLFEIYLKILLLNIRRNSGQSLKTLRSTLDRALDLYPKEPQFLSLFVKMELMSNVFCRMRRFFAKAYQPVLSNDRPFDDNWNLIVFAIHSELRRLDVNNEQFKAYDTNSGIVNRVRVLFERAVNTSALANCVTLWRLYCKFEMNCNNISKAKSVFYRALQCCPYSKILYLDGIQYFCSQLQQLLDIMTEKEVRIRTPLEEIDLLFNNLK